MLPSPTPATDPQPRRPRGMPEFPRRIIRGPPPSGACIEPHCSPLTPGRCVLCRPWGRCGWPWWALRSSADSRRGSCRTGGSPCGHRRRRNARAARCRAGSASTAASLHVCPPPAAEFHHLQTATQTMYTPSYQSVCEYPAKHASRVAVSLPYVPPTRPLLHTPRLRHASAAASAHLTIPLYAACRRPPSRARVRCVSRCVTCAACCAAVVMLSLFRNLFWFASALAAGSDFNNSMLRSVLRARLSFFHTTPTGRILNCFAKDQGTVDEQLPQATFDALQTLSVTCGAVILIAIANPPVIPVFLPLAYIFLRIRAYYVVTSREVKRIEAVTRSPVYAMFSTTLKGLPTIRAFGAQARFRHLFLSRLDMNGAWWMAYVATARCAAGLSAPPPAEPPPSVLASLWTFLV